MNIVRLGTRLRSAEFDDLISAKYPDENTRASLPRAPHEEGKSSQRPIASLKGDAKGIGISIFLIASLRIADMPHLRPLYAAFGTNSAAIHQIVDELYLQCS